MVKRLITGELLWVIITINYGFARYGTSKNPVATAAAHLAADWTRYDKGRTEYWEIGNENYVDWEMGYRIDVSKNQDGQPEFLMGDLYTKHFKVYADSMRKAAAEVGAKIKIGAVMQESKTQSWQTNTTKTWNVAMLPTIGNTPDFFIVHNYITPYDEASSVKTIVNSVRWDLLNGWQNGDDHGLFSDGGSSDDPHWNSRPSFYYMYYFQKTIGGRLVAKKKITTKAIKLFEFSDVEPTGCGYHPSIEEHEVMANQLLPFMQDVAKGLK